MLTSNEMRVFRHLCRMGGEDASVVEFAALCKMAPEDVGAAILTLCAKRKLIPTARGFRAVKAR